MVDSMGRYLAASLQDGDSIYKVGEHSIRLLMSVGDLLIGWLLQRQAAVCVERLADGASAEDTAFYQGKVAVSAFFAKTVLPELSTRARIVAAADTALMRLPDDAF